MTSRSSRGPIGTGPWLRAAAGGGVAGKVLERGDDAAALQTPHVCRPEHRDEVRVLPHGLLDPAPPVVTDDVEDRGESLVHPEGRHVPADRAGHPLDEIGVEGGAPGDGRRVDGGPEGGETGEALLVHDRRDAETGVVDDGLLLPDDLLRALLGAERDAAPDPRQVAEAVRGGLLERHGARGGEDVLHRRHVVHLVPLEEPVSAAPAPPPVPSRVRRLTTEVAEHPPAAELPHLLLEGQSRRGGPRPAPGRSGPGRARRRARAHRTTGVCPMGGSFAKNVRKLSTKVSDPPPRREEAPRFPRTPTNPP